MNRRNSIFDYQWTDISLYNMEALTTHYKMCIWVDC